MVRTLRDRSGSRTERLRRGNAVNQHGAMPSLRSEPGKSVHLHSASTFARLPEQRATHGCQLAQRMLAIARVNERNAGSIPCRSPRQDRTVPRFLVQEPICALPLLLPYRIPSPVYMAGTASTAPQLSLFLPLSQRVGAVTLSNFVERNPPRRDRDKDFPPRQMGILQAERRKPIIEPGSGGQYTRARRNRGSPGWREFHVRCLWRSTLGSLCG